MSCGATGCLLRPLALRPPRHATIHTCKANPETYPPEKANPAAPAPAATPSANAAPTTARTLAATAASPGSTTKAKGRSSTKASATSDTAVSANIIRGKAKAGKAKAAGAPAGLTEQEREAAACVAAAINRDLDFPARMAATSRRVLKEPFITAYRYAVLAQGASASPAWQAKLDAATPAMLARWLLQDVPRLARITYVAHNGLASSLIMRPTPEDWEAQHPDFQLWLHTWGFSALPTCRWVHATLVGTEAAPAASA